MATLLERLSDLSIRVGDIEARAEAFQTAERGHRTQKVCAMRAEVRGWRRKFGAALCSKQDEISSAWSGFNASGRARMEKIWAAVEVGEETHSINHAARRAERLEVNAVLAIAHAFLVLAEAELAVVEAEDARLGALEVAATTRR